MGQVLALMGACAAVDGESAPSGSPGEPVLLGSDRWRIDARASGLRWRGDELVTVVDDTLLTIAADGAVRREPLPAAASMVAAYGAELVIGTRAGGDLVRLSDGQRFDGPEGRIVAVDFAPDGGAVVSLVEPPRPAPPGGRDLRYPDRALLTRWSSDGAPLGDWTIESCRPYGLVHLRGALLVACGTGVVAVDLARGSLAPAEADAAWVTRSEDGAFAVTVGREGAAIWRPGARRPERSLPGRDILAAAVSTAGTAAVARPDRVSVEGGRELAGDALELAFSPDGRALAGRAGARVRRWDLATGLVDEAEGHEASVQAVALSDDGRTAASGSLDGVVFRWDTTTGRSSGVWRWEGPSSSIVAVAVVGDRVAAAADTRVRVLGGREWQLPGPVTGLSSGGEALYAHLGERRYRLDPEGAVVPVEPRDPPTGPYNAFPVPVEAASWSAAGFISGHDDGTVRVWSVAP